MHGWCEVGKTRSEEPPNSFRDLTLRRACSVYLRACIHVKVDASKVGQALYPLVIAEKETGSREGGGVPIGARALSAFRKLYRYTWDEPRVSCRERA